MNDGFLEQICRDIEELEGEPVRRAYMRKTTWEHFPPDTQEKLSSMFTIQYTNRLPHGDVFLLPARE